MLNCSSVYICLLNTWHYNPHTTPIQPTASFTPHSTGAPFSNLHTTAISPSPPLQTNQQLTLPFYSTFLPCHQTSLPTPILLPPCPIPSLNLACTTATPFFYILIDSLLIPFYSHPPPRLQPPFSISHISPSSPFFRRHQHRRCTTCNSSPPPPLLYLHLLRHTSSIPPVHHSSALRPPSSQPPIAAPSRCTHLLPSLPTSCCSQSPDPSAHICPYPPKIVSFDWPENEKMTSKLGLRIGAKGVNRYQKTSPRSMREIDGWPENEKAASGGENTGGVLERVDDTIVWAGNEAERESCVRFY